MGVERKRRLPPSPVSLGCQLAQAVQRLIDAGLVVVASAGNTGPAPMTLGVPGEVYNIGSGNCFTAQALLLTGHAFSEAAGRDGSGKISSSQEWCSR